MKLIGRAAAAFDRAVIRAFQPRGRRPASRTEAMSHEARLRRMEEIREAYGNDLQGFFVTPPPISPVTRRVRELRDGGEVLDLSWESTSVPHLATLRDAYLAHVDNRRAHARLLVGPGPRPAVVLIHGYLGGHWRIEERAWPIEWMRRCGLDVALALLPFHGLRAGNRAGRFPGADPRYTNEGFRQSVADLRALIAYLRARGAPAVGVMGMSLGGYTTALLATVERELAFAVPIIPLASIADFARDHGRLGAGHEQPLQHKALERATWMVSPLARPGLVAPERVLVVGAEADRITPIAHAERLARHFGAPMHRLPGGHLLQLGRGEAFREVRRLWHRIGVL